MVMYYLTKSTGKKVKAEILYFDLDFNYIKTENYEDDIEKVRQKYHLTWGVSCGEDSQPLLSVEANMMGSVVFKKGYIDRFYNWYYGFCDSKFRVEDKVKPKGDGGEQMKLYNYWSNNDIQEYSKSFAIQNRFGKVTPIYSISKSLMDAESGDVVICASNVVTIDKQKTNGLHWVFEKYSAKTLEKIKSTALDFPVAAQPIKWQILGTGNVAYVFQRADSKYEYIEVTYDGSIVRRNTIDMPNNFTWIIKDIYEQDGNLFIHGLTNKTKVTDKTIAAESTHPMMAESTYYASYEESPNGYQIMKVTPEKIDWITFTDKKEFAPTFVQMGAEKGKPYSGGSIKISDLTIGKTGNIFITGQKKSGGNFGEVVAFNFDSHGKLLTSYSSKLRAKNSLNKATSTIQTLINTPKGDGLYWTVFEVAGDKAVSFTSNERRTLYYPRIAKVSNDGKTTTDFMDIGGGEYYLDDLFPVNRISGNRVIYIGADKKGKTMWFAKVEME